MIVFDSLEFSVQALDDMEGLYEYLIDKNQDAAKRLVKRIYNACFNIEAFPLAGRVGNMDGTREFVIPRTKYVLIYKITATKIIVLAVYHTARNK